MKISASDRQFLAFLMGYYRIPQIRLESSTSQARHPDIWCFPQVVPPKIVVTQEWAKQSADERRKRLLHECRHILGEEHGKRGKLLYSTYPDKDTYSQALYNEVKPRYLAYRKIR